MRLLKSIAAAAAIGLTVIAACMALTAFAQASPDADQGWTVLARGADLSGGGPGAFGAVRGVGVDSQSNVYVADAANARLQKLSPQGAPLAQWPSFASKATSAQSYGLGGVAVDRQDNVYALEDVFGGRIQKFSPQGQLLAEWGSPPPPRQGPPGFGGYQYPLSLAVDGQGNLYRVVLTPDGPSFRIQKLSSKGTQVALWGTSGDGPGQFRSPNGLAVDGSDNLYVADSGNQSVQKLSPDGSPLAQWGVGGQGPDQWGSPVALAVDPDGNIYVTFLGGVEKLSPQGELLTRWGNANTGDQPGQFGMASSVAVDRQGSLYVGEEGNRRIQKLSATGPQSATPAKPTGSTPPASGGDASPAAPAVQQLDAGAGEATCGSIMLTWTSLAPSFSTTLQTAAISAVDATGATVFQVSQDLLGGMSLSPDWCGDILGDGSQVLAYSTFSGGAHCCYEGAVVRLDGSGRHLLDWGLGSFYLLPPQQLNGSGPLEIPAASPIFNYYDNLGFVNSPTLPIVYAYDGSGYVEATARFPGYFAADVAKAEAELAAARARPALEQESDALRVYALHLLLGDGQKTLPAVEARVGPVAAGWLASHAAEIRDMMANAYTLPGNSLP